MSESRITSPPTFGLVANCSSVATFMGNRQPSSTGWLRTKLIGSVAPQEGNSVRLPDSKAATKRRPFATARARGAWAVSTARAPAWKRPPAPTVSASTSLRLSRVTKARSRPSKAMPTGSSVVETPLASRTWITSTTARVARLTTAIESETWFATSTHSSSPGSAGLSLGRTARPTGSRPTGTSAISP